MSLSLYELSETYLKALDFLSDTDLPAEAVADTLEGLEGELQEKCVNVAKYLKNLEATAEAMKEAEAGMAKRRKVFESLGASMKEYLKINMERTGITKIDCPYFSIAVQKNPVSVHVIDEELISLEFYSRKVEYTLNKVKLKEAIQNGIDVQGAELINGTRLVIK